MASNKTLYRSTKNQVLGGVCSGIAEHFDTDPVLIRIIFVVLALAGGSGVLLYLVLLAVVPEEHAAGSAGTGSTRASTAEPMHSSAYHSANRPTSLDDHVRDLRDRMQRSHNHAHGLLGLVVIVFGAFLLLNGYYPSVSFQQVLGILIIVIGVALIARRHDGQG